MGLSDLKKNVMPSRGSAQALTLDEFIDAATLYAMGETRMPSTAAPYADDDWTSGEFEVTIDSSNVVTLHRPQTMALVAGTDVERPHFRKATFSLSEVAISHLALLSQESEISKSKLIRFLIEQHYALPTALRQMREQQIKNA
ncbi:CopG family transcriptional regulator [Shewanella acanthi]|uniref:CopG family transcriptional regulator n=1 Tax=Shewanella acanthi TaxID=2864212 RepID=UPI001C65E125|nr:CopG family transcriptional regulator [Shewanella acanthi]QYJ79821.1 CopG family transcriptional regulator [Shewanella acanthi]